MTNNKNNHPIPDQPTQILRSELDAWIKPSHQGGAVPGFHIDSQGQYDINVCGDDVMIIPWSKRLTKPSKSHITQHPDESFIWICPCGSVDGFQTCLKNGRIVEPTEADWTDGPLYCCLSCGNIFNSETLRITGKCKQSVNEHICMSCKQDTEHADLQCSCGGEHLTYG